LTDNHVVVIMKLSQCQQALKDFLRSDETVTCHYFENVGTELAFYTTDRQEIFNRPMPYFSLCVVRA
jgi:precorrin-2/cobalt-factor-2 C20-methyltransferase